MSHARREVTTRELGDVVHAAPVLVARGLRKSYGSAVALAAGELEIRRGEVVAVTGPSGSGKSTLLQCAAGITLPDSGAVWLDGQSVTDLPDAARARLRRTAFGFVFQFGQLVPELTVRENVALPLLLNGVRRRKAMAAAAEWLTVFGVDELSRRRPGEVSGGQAQRVAVARAMVIEPMVVFADEPTGSLDSTSGSRVLEALVDAAHERSVAVMIVTHDAAVAARADREVVVRDGVTMPSDDVISRDSRAGVAP
ncbi:ABC transporter ATP-binding protein [Cellulomonas sp. SLBN-39]|uniref:ABC transporter ATP-binding protein n=1 Tax=Cellulomonas sp. SLBN-39 TaxID=2768446 RepID=UPI001575DEFC|nr:ATP-binding cassette domain-containing protein [Cellulomonas sp. SLBN-39]